MRSTRSRRTAAQMSVVVAGLLFGRPASARADWMVTAMTGHLWTNPSTARIFMDDRQTEIDLVDLRYRSESFKTPPYYGYRISWIPDRHPGIGVEGEFIHAKMFAETDRVVRIRGTLHGAAFDASVPLSSVVQNLAMSHGLNFVFANLALRRGLGERDSHGDHRFTVVVRAGAGPTVPHAESTIEGASREQFEGGGLGAQVGGGLEMTVKGGLRALGEYKFTWASPDIAVAGGAAHIPARSHHLVGGLAYQF